MGCVQTEKEKQVWTTDVNVSGYPGWETSLVCNYKSRKKVQKELSGLFWCLNCSSQISCFPCWRTGTMFPLLESCYHHPSHL